MILDDHLTPELNRKNITGVQLLDKAFLGFLKFSMVDELKRKNEFRRYHADLAYRIPIKSRILELMKNYDLRQNKKTNLETLT